MSRENWLTWVCDSCGTEVSAPAESQLAGDPCPVCDDGVLLRYRPSLPQEGRVGEADDG
jgi:DNA-directed RNA polymerase subunit RPC12/RpoP